VTDRVKQILLAARVALVADLERAAVHQHPTAKGTATETGWGRFLADHLPRRYEVTQGFVVDRSGRESEQLDLIICDRYFTTVLCDDRAARYIPAESVYAVFEIKQSLSKEHVEAAHAKVESVRKLERTSVAIPHAGGVYPPKQPFPILGGLLATRSEWSPAFGAPLRTALAAAPASARVDLIATALAGAAEVGIDPSGEIVVSASATDVALPWFFLTLVHRLQERGTVGAADYLAYRSAL
jgi:hypothetical protein